MMKNRLQYQTPSALTILLLALLTVGAVRAWAQSEEVLTLDIEPQDAGSALMTLARISGVHIMLEEGAGARVDVEGLKGEYRFEEALAALLTDTGLKFQYASENMVVVQVLEQAEQPDAAEQDAAEEELRPMELPEQTVTGSRLRSALGGAPMFVITREEIKQRGLGSMDDLGRILTQNFSEVNAAAARDNSINSADAQGQAMINLRGFNESSTLVLVNGRRWPQASSFGNGAVNINGVPFSAIERVEVLTDGASAIYGADAQAGVINFILRDDWQGGETMVRYDMGANEGDSRTIEQNLSISWDQGRASLSLSQVRKDSVDSQKAGYTTADLTALGGSDNRYQPDGFFFLGQPGAVGYGIPLGFYNLVITPLGSLPQGDDGTSGVFSKLSLENQVPWDEPARNPGATASNDESLTGHLSVEQDFLDGALNVFGEFTFGYSDSKSHRGSIRYLGAVPTTNPYNDIPPHPFLQTVVAYSFANEFAAGILDPLRNDSDQNNRRTTLGLKAELPFRDWIGEFSASRGKEESWFEFHFWDEELLAERIAGVDASGNPLPMDQIINPFGDGSAQSPAAMEGLVIPAGPRTSSFGAVYYANWNFSRQDDYNLSLNGSVWDLPGGAVQWVVGGELRTETLDYSDDNSRTSFFLVTDPEREVTSFFTELGVPLVGEKNRMAGVHALGLKFAARSDDYSFSGPFEGAGSPYTEKTFDRVSPKVELAWYPVQTFKLRASWGQSFVPPESRRLFEVERGGSTIPWVPLRDIENPDQGLLFPPVYNTGNPDLEPEISTTLAVGFDWSPGGALDGLSLQVTWFDVEFKDKFGSGFSIFRNQPELMFEIPRMIIRDEFGNIARVNLFTVNLARRFSEYLDASLRYDFDTGRWGNFSLGADGTYTSLLRDVSFAGADPTDLHGTPTGPERWKANGYVSWLQGDVALTVTARYSSSYAGFFYSPQERVENYLTWDLTGSYEFGNSGWKIYAGARNITDAEFPFFDGLLYPWDARRVDTRGRILHFEIRKSYDIF